MFSLSFFAGLRSARSDMQGQVAVKALQAQHGDQQRAHAQVRSREPLQVSRSIALFLLFTKYNQISSLRQ